MRSRKTVIFRKSLFLEDFETAIIHKNNETNDKFNRKVAFLTYTESVKFRSQSRFKTKTIPRTGH